MTGFLLGAGASYELGLPLVDELTLQFKKALYKNRNASYYKVPKEIESIAFPLLQDCKLNYEDIIGKIEVEFNRCRSNNTLYQKWHGVLQQYLEAVYYLLLEQHFINKHYIAGRLTYFESLKNYCKSSPLWIFSLNHDLLIEIIAKYLGIPIKSGFHDKTYINGYSFEKLSRENMENNKFSFFQNESGINLIKLHGALDVFVQGVDKNYLKLVNNSNDTTGVIDDVNNLLRNDVMVKEGIRCTNEITYYDDSKVLQFLRITVMSGKHKYSSRISHTMDDWFFKIYKGHINYVKNLYCIGYSFQDLHVNTVLYDWLSFTNKRKMIIVNPYMKTIPNQFSHLSDQIDIINLGFLEFLNQGSPKKLMSVKLNCKLRDLARKKIIKSK